MLVHSGVFQLHEFFSIFAKFDPKISRQLRLTVFFLKILLILAVSGLFSQQMNEYQAMLFSIISTVVVNVPIAIIMVLMKTSVFILKWIGVLVNISLIFASLYAILTVSALMGQEESTKWAINYATSYITNQFFIVPLTTFVKLVMANKAILKQIT